MSCCGLNHGCQRLRLQAWETGQAARGLSLPPSLLGARRGTERVGRTWCWDWTRSGGETRSGRASANTAPSPPVQRRPRGPDPASARQGTLPEALVSPAQRRLGWSAHNRRLSVTDSRVQAALWSLEGEHPPDLTRASPHGGCRPGKLRETPGGAPRERAGPRP